MRGTFVYDIITTIGLIIMVFLITFWAVKFGADQISTIFLSDPSAIQGTIATSIGFSCLPYEKYSIELKTQTHFSGILELKEKTVEIKPPTQGGAGRGGFIKFHGIGPSQVITCNNARIPEESINFEKSSALTFVIKKENGEVSAEVR